jgi:hypothetical protein
MSSSENVTYEPGETTVFQNGLQLSQGLLSRVIAKSGMPVTFDTVGGGASAVTFHSVPDGAAVFSRPQTDGWVYVSNSEALVGGVGAIYFNSQGQKTGYSRILSGTARNCGGGKTWWNTWLTCEEYDAGQVWEVSPWGEYSHKTVVSKRMMNYESVAYDNRNVSAPKIYATVE